MWAGLFRTHPGRPRGWAAGWRSAPAPRGHRQGHRPGVSPTSGSTGSKAGGGPRAGDRRPARGGPRPRCAGRRGEALRRRRTWSTPPGSGERSSGVRTPSRAAPSRRCRHPPRPDDPDETDAVTAPTHAPAPPPAGGGSASPGLGPGRAKRKPGGDSGRRRCFLLGATVLFVVVTAFGGDATWAGCRRPPGAAWSAVLPGLVLRSPPFTARDPHPHTAIIVEKDQFAGPSASSSGRLPHADAVTARIRAANVRRPIGGVAGRGHSAVGVRRGHDGAVQVQATLVRRGRPPGARAWCGTSSDWCRPMGRASTSLIRDSRHQQAGVGRHPRSPTAT